MCISAHKCGLGFGVDQAAAGRCKSETKMMGLGVQNDAGAAYAVQQSGMTPPRQKMKPDAKKQFMGRARTPAPGTEREKT